MAVPNPRQVCYLFRIIVLSATGNNICNQFSLQRNKKKNIKQNGEGGSTGLSDDNLTLWMKGRSKVTCA